MPDPHSLSPTHTAQVESATSRPTTSPGPAGRKQRLVGVDVARGTAVLGMFAAHFNPYMMNPEHWLQQLVSGRSSALFALLAGVSVALLSGGSTPHRHEVMRASRVHLAVRAVLLFLLGLALSALGTPVKEILTVYGVLFLLAIPLLRVPAVVLAGIAAILATVGPLTSFALRSTLFTQYRPGLTPSFDDFLSVHGLVETVQGLLLTGPYPVLTWLPFLLAGLAIGRSDLRSTAVRVWLLVSGTVLATLAYAASWLLMNPLGGYARIVENTAAVNQEQAHAMSRSTIGVVPTDDPTFLLTTAPHSGAPLEIYATSGLAMAIIGAALILANRFTTVFLPLSSIGALALTSYAGHIVVIFLIGYGGMVALLTNWLYGPLLVLIGTTAIFTMAWRRWLGRGPLEWVLHKVATKAGNLTRRC